MIGPSRLAEEFWQHGRSEACPIYDMHYACRDLSDHHFINGYFVRAAAMVAMFDPNGAAWAGAWGPMVEQLIKDPMNWDRADTGYAFLRHYSPVEGHSWASGICPNIEANFI